MNIKIPNVHKILIALALLVIAAQVLAYFYVLRPARNEVTKQTQALERAKADLRKNNWPTNIVLLTAIKNEIQDKLDGDDEETKSISTIYKMAMEKAGHLFSVKISKEYSGFPEFRRNASRLEYQAEHNRVFSDIAKRGFVLDPEAVGLDENASSPYIYQQMLQLWTLEELLTMAADSGLSLQPLENPSQPQKGKMSIGGNVKAQLKSSVFVLPMKSYVINEKDAPYLAEFPVYLKLKGNLPSLLNFLAKLQTDNVYLPASSFEILAVPPDKVAAGPDGLIASGTMYFNLLCSSFLPLDKK